MKFKLWLCFYLTVNITSAQDYFNLEPEYEGVYEPTFTQEELGQMKLPHSTSNDVDYDICKASKQYQKLNYLLEIQLGNASATSHSGVQWYQLWPNMAK